MRQARRAIARFFRRVLAGLLFPLTLSRQLSRLTEQVRILTSASVESVSYVGVELRSLETGLQTLAADLAALRRQLGLEESAEETDLPGALHRLAAVEPPARILAVGAVDDELLASLRSRGHEVTVQREPSTDLAVEPGSFDAILCAAGEPDPGAIGSFTELLGAEGVLVVAAPAADSSGDRPESAE